MGLRTPLYDSHVELGAKIVDFGGCDMPLHYGSQLEEHHAVRKDCGLFDVSHMQIVDIEGSGSRSFLRHVLANDVEKLKVPGKALYTCMLDGNGGVIDDLIVYFFREDFFRLVVNAGTADKDVRWLSQLADRGQFSVHVPPQRDRALLAIQGPNAREVY